MFGITTQSSPARISGRDLRGYEADWKQPDGGRLEVGLEQTQDSLERRDILLTELTKLGGVDVEDGNHLVGAVRRRGEHRQCDFALGPGVARDVAGEALYIGDDHGTSGTSARQTDSLIPQDLAGHGSLIGPDVELIVSGDKVEPSPEVVGHLMM